MKNRKLKNLLLDRAFQGRFALQTALVGVIIISTFTVAFVIQFEKLKNIISGLAPANDEIYYQIIGQMSGIYFVCLSSLVVATLFVSVSSLFLSHRIAGPTYAIRQYIAELKHGNFSMRRKLRPKDHLQEVMQELNELAESLEKKGK